jgi:putative serine protease PepD
MNPSDPDDRHDPPAPPTGTASGTGEDDPTRPIPAGAADEDTVSSAGYGEEPRPQHEQGYGYHPYGQGPQSPPPYYGYGSASGSPYWPQGPTPPGPTHASGPLMTPGEGGGFGHSAPPAYQPPHHRGGAGRNGRRPEHARPGVALLVAAVLAGGLAGVGGAAAYDALDPDDSPAVVDSLQSSQSSEDSEASAPAPAGSVEAVAAEVLPSVVKIDVVSADGQGSGSGIILSADGVILTNNHVVEGADGGDISVSFNDGDTASAEVVGTDPLTDLAVIKAEGVSGLQSATLGDSAAVDVGEQVIAVGSPFGLESTVTSGIVSALHRPVSAGDAQGDQSTIFPAIQTDAAINPGNSGGALVNMDGEVIGINTAIRSTTNLTGEAGSIGLGFAIPIDEAEPIAQQLVDGETPTHARLGVTVSTPGGGEGLPGAPVPEGDGTLPSGAVVRSVSPGTAAEDAGLQRGDIITRVDDNIISSSDALVAMIRTYRPGDQVQLTFIRDGSRQTITVTLGSDAGSSAS